jgi:hypothetical protein
MKRRSDYEIAERIKEPLVGQLAWSEQKDCTVMYIDADQGWCEIQMPHFMFSMTDLKPERYGEFLDWLKMMYPHLDPVEVGRHIAATINASDVEFVAQVLSNDLKGFMSDE